MRDSKDVAKRALLQGALSFRAQMENQLAQGSEQAEQIIDKHRAWLKRASLFDAFDEEEQMDIEAGAGEWDDEDIGDAFWKIESFKALLWALNHYEQMPPFHVVGDVNAIYKMTQFPGKPFPFIRESVLRSTDELGRELEVYKFLNWRGRTEMLKLQGQQPPNGFTYETILRKAMAEAPRGSTSLTVGANDILIDGVAYSELEDLQTPISAAYERHRALVWLNGSQAWSETLAHT